ncbi:site-specific integrase (plasmid) [Variovorax sp. V59]|uniref:site-specific integrase n=1 Tax=unclassified Variovorax TaxID=663243 RepID=UPI0034E8E04E
MTYSAPTPDREQINRLTSKVVGDGLSQFHSRNTVASYCSAMRYWFAWYQLRFGGEMKFPVSVLVVVQFIVDHAALPAPMRRAIAFARDEACATDGTAAARETKGPLPNPIDELLVNAGFKAELGSFTLSTLIARLAALSSVHQSLNSENPCKHVRVRELMGEVRQEYAKHGVAEHGLTAFTQETFNAVLATCDDSPTGRRDRALLLFAWEGGGRRRSEVASATMENLCRVGPQHYVYFLPGPKTTRQVASEKPLTGDAAVALDAWLEIRGLAEGPLFRSIRRNGRCSSRGLNPEAIRRIVKDRCRRAGLPNEYSAHSLRSGFVAEAGRRNIGLNAAMDLSGHKHFMEFARHYYQNEHALGGVVIDLMTDDCHKPAGRTK